MITASRGAAVPSRHRRNSCPSDEVVGGFFIDFGTVRAPRRRSTDVIDVTPSSRGSIAFGRWAPWAALSTALEPTGTPSPRAVDGRASGVADASWVSAWPRTHRRATCVKSKISDAPHHRHDVVPITASARWRGASTPSTRRCPQYDSLTHWLISTEVRRWRDKNQQLLLNGTLLTPRQRAPARRRPAGGARLASRRALVYGGPRSALPPSSARQL